MEGSHLRNPTRMDRGGLRYCRTTQQTAQVEVRLVFEDFEKYPSFVIARLPADYQTFAIADEEFMLTINHEALTLRPFIFHNFKTRFFFSHCVSNNFGHIFDILLAGDAFGFKKIGIQILSAN